MQMYQPMTARGQQIPMTARGPAPANVYAQQIPMTARGPAPANAYTIQHAATTGQLGAYAPATMQTGGLQRVMTPTPAVAMQTQGALANGGMARTYAATPQQVTYATPQQVTYATGAMGMQSRIVQAAPTTLQARQAPVIQGSRMMGSPVTMGAQPMMSASRVVTAQGYTTQPRVVTAGAATPYVVSGSYTGYSGGVVTQTLPAANGYSTYAVTSTSTNANFSALKKIMDILRDPSALARATEELFLKHDINQSGGLSIDQWKNCAEELSDALGVNIVTEETGQDKDRAMTMMLKKFDCSQTGELSLEEFQKLFNYLLFKKKEEIDPPKFSREAFIGQMKHPPSQKYNQEKELGQGAYGIVYLMRHKKTQELRVMKVVNKQKAMASGTPLEMLQGEISTLQLLDHPHVLRLFEYYVDSQNFNLIMDLVPGGELLEQVENSCKGPKRGSYFDEKWVATIMEQVLQAISYCHAKGVMHKDLKLENVMLRDKEAPDAVVIDVGLAELFGTTHHKQQRSHLVAGSLSTMAPEVLQQDFSYECDIWSLGCVLYSLFCERPNYVPDGKGGQALYPYPFLPQPTAQDPSGMQGLRAAQMRGFDAGAVRHASPEALDLMRKMLTFQENRRPKAAECLEHPFFNQIKTGRGRQGSISQKTADLLTSHRGKDTWHRAVMLEAATQLPAKKLKHLHAEFAQLDVDHDGFISKSEMVAALVQQGVDKATADQVVSAADVDGSGNIEFSEFCAALLPADREALEGMLSQAFHQFDTDGDGTLSKGEVRQLLQSGMVAATKMPEDKSVDMMLLEMKDPRSPGGNNISFDEFRDYFLNLGYGAN